MTDQDSRTDDPAPEPPLPDSYALRRRVLLTGLLTLIAFVACGMALTSLEAPPWLILPAMVLVYAAAVRPLMRPVRAANQQRRDLAYHAFLVGREQAPDGGAGD